MVIQQKLLESYAYERVLGISPGSKLNDSLKQRIIMPEAGVSRRRC